MPASAPGEFDKPDMAGGSRSDYLRHFMRVSEVADLQDLEQDVCVGMKHLELKRLVRIRISRYAWA